MTNDLISRKDLLGMFENRKWFFTSDIINSINFRPAVSGDQVDRGKVVHTTDAFIPRPSYILGKPINDLVIIIEFSGDSGE